MRTIGAPASITPPFLRRMPFLLQPSQIYPGLGQAPNTAGLFTWWLADHDHDHAAKMQNKTERHSLPSHPPDIPTPSFSSSASYQCPKIPTHLFLSLALPLLSTHHSCHQSLPHSFSPSFSANPFHRGLLLLSLPLQD